MCLGYPALLQDLSPTPLPARSQSYVCTCSDGVGSPVRFLVSPLSLNLHFCCCSSGRSFSEISAQCALGTLFASGIAHVRMLKKRLSTLVKCSTGSLGVMV